MSTPFEIIEKADLFWRDNQPYSQHFNDIYFSVDNGFLETEEVFIHANCLPERWAALHAQKNVRFVIAETGFGAGLNFLITWYFWQQYAPASATLYYYSCEKHPLSLSDLQKCLAFWPQLNPLIKEFLSNYPVLTPGFHPLSFQKGRVNLILMLGDVCQCYQQLLVEGDNALTPCLPTFSVDAWFLDGFAPVKNEAMWSEEFFEIMGLLSHGETTASTYSAAGVVKARLLHNGFLVKRVSGFGKKKHRLEARFDDVCNRPSRRFCRKRLTPWDIAPQTRRSGEPRALVVGGGLAGCFTAHSLAKRGWQVTVLEACDQVGQGASGNTGAVLYPQLSAFRSPLTEFMLMAFLVAVQFYRPKLGGILEGQLNGILQFAATQRERATQVNLQTWLAAYPELGRLVSGEEASDLAGLRLKEGGLFIPDSGWVNSQRLCDYLVDNPLITVKTNNFVDSLSHSQGLWEAGGEQAAILVIANGNAVTQFKETHWVPIKSVAGQMTFIKANEQCHSLKIPLCGNSHLLPANQEKHALGATFHIKTSNFHQSSQDDALNVARLQQLPIDWDFIPEIVGSWGGVRAAAPDYLPLVGPVTFLESFFKIFADLAKDGRRFIPARADHYPGLYLCTGFGSRGLTSAPLCGEWLASQINQEPSFIPRTLEQALSPSRFLRQTILRGGGMAVNQESSFKD